MDVLERLTHQFPSIPAIAEAAFVAANATSIGDAHLGRDGRVWCRTTPRPQYGSASARRAAVGSEGGAGGTRPSRRYVGVGPPPT